MITKRNLCGLSLLIISMISHATEIIIGPGSGIIWSGNPYSINPSVKYPTSPGAPRHTVGFGFASGLGENCGENSSIVSTQEGTIGYRITQGVYLMPRAVISGTTRNLNGQYGPNGIRHFSGTVGYPKSKILDTDTNEAWELLANSWCFRKYFAPDSSVPFKANISGDWVVYTDGTQVASDVIYKAPDIKAFLTAGFSKDNYKLMDKLTFRVVGVECLVNTNANINFGNSVYNTTPDTELAAVTSPFSVSCKQGSLPTTININASFRANTGIFNNNNTQLALTQGGGYITGEISNGVTGSGACMAHPTAVNFSQVPLKLTTLTSADPGVDFNSTITWRLCSGGASLPVGNIDSSAELSIVFS